MVVMRSSVLVGVGAMSALLLGCGSSSHTTAQTARCPAGKTLISGHFHFYGCVPSQEARVLFICNEGGYELAGILDLSDATSLLLPHPAITTAATRSALRKPVERRCMPSETIPPAEAREN